MAVRSKEELSLASVFMHTLSNLLALTAAEEPRSWPTLAQLAAAPQHDLVASPALFRMLQLAVLPEVLGENAGPTIWRPSGSAWP
jgi:hypothetical protein